MPEEAQITVKEVGAMQYVIIASPPNFWNAELQVSSTTMAAICGRDASELSLVLWMLQLR